MKNTRKPERQGASTKRTKAAKDRLRADGLARVEVWVYPDQKQAVKDYASALVMARPNDKHNRRCADGDEREENN